MDDFWYLGIFGHEKSIGASPEFQKIFCDPLPGYPMLKNQFFQLFYFGFKLADFWYSGVFEHEKSIGTSPKVQKIFMIHYEKVNIFNMGYPRLGVKKFFLESETCANRFLVPENPRVPKISQFGAKIKKLKKLNF